MKPEYQLRDMVRGKYFERYQNMRLKVMIDPDVARVFPDSTAVNEALRAFVRLEDVKANPSPARRRKAG